MSDEKTVSKLGKLDQDYIDLIEKNRELRKKLTEKQQKADLCIALEKLDNELQLK
jgi:hypothetical protein